MILKLVCNNKKLFPIRFMYENNLPILSYEYDENNFYEFINNIDINNNNDKYNFIGILNKKIIDLYKHKEYGNNLYYFIFIKNNKIYLYDHLMNNIDIDLNNIENIFNYMSL